MTQTSSITILIIFIFYHRLLDCGASSLDDSGLFELKYTANIDRSVTLHFSYWKEVEQDFKERWRQKGTSGTSPDKFHLNITYYPVFDPSTSVPLACHDKVDPVEDRDTNTQVCRDALFKFSHYNETSVSDDAKEILRYCDARSKLFEIDAMGGPDPFVIQDLLPMQLYILKVGLMLDLELVAHHVEVFCTTHSAPMFPPQSDFSSFHVLKDDYIDDQHGVSGPVQEIRLLWRPLPYFLAGSNDTTYDLVCAKKSLAGNKVVHKILGYSPLKPHEGYRNIIKPSGEQYICKITAENQFGISSYSYINIPSSKNILKFPDDFQFHVVNVAGNQFNMSWTPMETYQRPGRNMENPTNYQRYYTIYWCHSNNDDCESIAGFVKLDQVGYSITLPGDQGWRNKDNKLIRFGISYWDGVRQSPSGIIWTKCISQLQSISQPLELYTPSMHSLEAHQSIKISWKFKICGSMSAVIHNYQIRYCPISRITDCSILYSIPSNDLFPVFDNDRDTGAIDKLFESTTCGSLNISYQLTSEVLLSSLLPSTGYMIRARYSLLNGTTNPWSEPIFASTSVDPVSRNRCLKLYMSLISSVMLVCFIAGCLVYPKWRRQVNHCLMLSFRFESTRFALEMMFGDAHKQSENSSEIPMHHCMQTQNGVNQDVSASLLNLEDPELERFKRAIFSDPFVDRNNNADYPILARDDHDPTLEYVPTCVMRGFNELDGATKGSNNELSSHEHVSMLDDLSITSQSSFLETILTTDNNGQEDPDNLQ